MNKRSATVSILGSLAVCSVSFIGLRAHAQTSTDMVSTRSSLSYTFDNASGFSITNNGTLNYLGALNQSKGSPCCASARLTAIGPRQGRMGQTTRISEDNYWLDTRMRAKREGGNTLSSELDTATLPVDDDSDNDSDNVGLQYLVFGGGVTRIKILESYTEQEKVDSQSLSIFPQYT